jgi:hypothetical protein
MRKEDDPTNFGAHFSDVWSDAQTLRRVSFGLHVLKAWRQLFRRASADRDQPAGNARQVLGA